jgi:hypothetical protein
MKKKEPMDNKGLKKWRKWAMLMKIDVYMWGFSILIFNYSIYLNILNHWLINGTCSYEFSQSIILLIEL